jgi:hypothetical protein
MEEPCIRGYGINMGFWRWGGYSVGGFYFQVTFFNKELPDPLQDRCSLLKGFLSSYQWPVFRHGPTL